MAEVYRDEHRIFLQAMLTRGSMGNKEAHEVFEIALERCGSKKNVFVSVNF